MAYVYHRVLRTAGTWREDGHYIPKKERYNKCAVGILQHPSLSSADDTVLSSFVLEVQTKSRNSQLPFVLNAPSERERPYGHKDPSIGGEGTQTCQANIIQSKTKRNKHPFHYLLMHKWLHYTQTDSQFPLFCSTRNAKAKQIFLEWLLLRRDKRWLWFFHLCVSLPFFPLRFWFPKYDSLHRTLELRGRVFCPP